MNSVVAQQVHQVAKDAGVRGVTVSEGPDAQVINYKNHTKVVTPNIDPIEALAMVVRNAGQRGAVVNRVRQAAVCAAA